MEQKLHQAEEEMSSFLGNGKLFDTSIWKWWRSLKFEFIRTIGGKGETIYKIYGKMGLENNFSEHLKLVAHILQ